MTTTNTMLEVIQEILKRVPDLGYFATADAVGTTYIDHDAKFGNSRLATDQYADRFIYRPNRTGDDRVKIAGNLTKTNGQLAHTSVDNYSNTSDLDYILMGLHPDVLINAIIRGWARLSTGSHRPLTTFPDADMETSGAGAVYYWDGTTDGAVSNAAVTKVTTAATVFSGTQALFLNLSGSGGYTRGAKIGVQPGQQIYTAARVRCVAGSTFTLNLYNVTGSAVFTGTAPTYSGVDWAVVWRVDTVPSGCYQIQVQPTGSGATDDIYIDAVFGPYVQGRRTFNLETWMDQSWRVKLIRTTSYGLTVGGSQAYDAWSRTWAGDFVPPNPPLDSGDFSLEFNRRDANPYRVNFYHDLPQCPLEMYVERLISDTETFAAPSDTTIVDFNQLCDYSMEELAEVMTTQYAKGDQGWAQILNDYRGMNSLHVIARPQQARREPRRPIRIVA